MKDFLCLAFGLSMYVLAPSCALAQTKPAFTYDEQKEVAAAEMGVERVAPGFVPTCLLSAPDNNTTLWVQVDLGSRQRIDGIKVLRTIGRLFRTYRPMEYFGLLSAVLMLLGILFVIPVLEDYAQTGMVARFPTLIVCGFVMLAAIISFFAGLLLMTLRMKDRQEFEMRLHAASDQKKRLMKEKKD